MKVKASDHNPSLINFEEWNLNAVDEIQKRILLGIKEVIDLVVTYDAVMSPYWDDKGEVNVEIRLPLGESDGSDQPTWTCSMRDLLVYAVDDAKENDDEVAKSHPGAPRMATNSLRDLLREILKKLEADDA